MSWDDGSPYDVKLADLLNKYKISSTFYIPKRNSEGLPVLLEKSIRLLSAEFEIGAHTIDHVRLNKTSSTYHKHQISNSKLWLEDTTGSPVYGFCYPGGVYDNDVINKVKDAGFFYARTTENFRNNTFNIFEMPTTLQIFNHKSYVLFLNMMKFNNRLVKFSEYYPVLLRKSFSQRVIFLLKYAIDNKLPYIHLWGHSWELQENNYWSELEDIFKYINEHRENFLFVTNHQCAIFYNNNEPD